MHGECESYECNMLGVFGVKVCVSIDALLETLEVG
jgi:hypothetical protein